MGKLTQRKQGGVRAAWRPPNSLAVASRACPYPPSSLPSRPCKRPGANKQRAYSLGYLAAYANPCSPKSERTKAPEEPYGGMREVSNPEQGDQGPVLGFQLRYYVALCFVFGVKDKKKSIQQNGIFPEERGTGTAPDGEHFWVYSLSTTHIFYRHSATTLRRGTCHRLVQRNGAQTRRRKPMERQQGLASMSRIKEKKIAL